MSNSDNITTRIERVHGQIDIVIGYFKQRQAEAEKLRSHLLTAVEEYSDGTNCSSEQIERVCQDIETMVSDSSDIACAVATRYATDVLQHTHDTLLHCQKEAKEGRMTPHEQKEIAKALHELLKTTSKMLP